MPNGNPLHHASSSLVAVVVVVAAQEAMLVAKNTDRSWQPVCTDVCKMISTLRAYRIFIVHTM